MAPKIKFFILFSIFSLPSLALSAKLSLDPSQSLVEFSAVGRPSMIHIKGKDAQVTGTLVQSDANLSGELKVDLEQFHTGIEFRDKHMREKYLETPKNLENKYAVLTITKMMVPATLLQKGGEQKSLAFAGKLQLHGVTKAIQGTADLSIQNQKAIGTSSFALKLGDYGIAIPSFAGVTVAEEVQVDVHFAAKVE